MTANLAIALLFGFSGMMVGLRHILLMPSHGNFPNAAFVTRIGLFSLAGILAACGVLFWYHRDSEWPYAGQASPFVAVLLLVFAVHAAVQTWCVFKRRYTGFIGHTPYARVVPFQGSKRPHTSQMAIHRASKKHR